MAKEHIMNTYQRFDVIFEKGSGARVYDTQGKEYIDFVSGIAVNTLGHAHPAITKTLTEQSQKLMHVSNSYWTPSQLKLAEKLAQYSNHDQVFFCNSGTEAIEVSLKLARKYGKIMGKKDKTEIIYMNNSFHGRTMGALSVTGQSKYQKDFMPLVPDTTPVQFNDIQDLQNAISNKTCAVILEPIQGEGGIIEADIEFLKETRKLCKKFHALLIFDEVQCGIGRLGTLFAYQSYGIIPDVICMAKGLGGGFPMGACLATKEAASVFVPGDHGNTFGGNPLACSVGLTILEELMEHHVLDNVNLSSQYLVKKLNILKQKYPIIKNIQGKGLLLGMKIEGDPKVIIHRCFEKGLLLVSAGQDIIRILPPLNIKKEDIDAMLTILNSVLEEL
ncbi:aspartate aminotransferase family protein [Garciella nitratireducens]|uniref:aspartate aminotransferase family protein n=1 Tax=Garciella nitratireducens TaxID=218205 RepID=UPI000DEA9D5B|nr:aspartate aminotransferase family protein [Garciella nitratireducens]RBP46896.1 acetylornithine aminotransferase [Garciella nitratireducens]